MKHVVLAAPLSAIWAIRNSLGSELPRGPWIPRFTVGLAQLCGKLNMDDTRVRMATRFIP